MASFSSSVINKGGKKFAPKAPVRRPGAAVAVKRPPPAQAAPQQTAPQPPPLTAVPTPTPPSAPEQFPAPAPVESSPKPPQISTPAPSKHAIPLPSQRPSAPPGAVLITPGAKTAPGRPTHQVIEPPTPPPSQARPSRTESDQRASVNGASSQGAAFSTSKPPTVSATKIVPGASSRAIKITPGAPTSGPTKITPGVPSSGATKIMPTAVPRPTTITPAVSNPQSIAEDSVETRPAKRVRVEAPAPAGPYTGVNNSSSQTETTNPDAAQRKASKKAAGTKKPAAKTTKSRAKRKRSTEDGGDETGTDGTAKKPRGRRKREPTPENAEEIEIVTDTVTMSDLCRDMRIGRKSKREMELRSMNWDEIARKKKEREEKEKEEAAAGRTRERESESVNRPKRENPVSSGPQMRIVNGEIVLDTTSLHIDRHAEAAADMDDLEEVEENPLTRKINTATFGKRQKTEGWDEDLTDLFYRGLRMFGTDFMMISKMFPGRTRRHIKLKFSNEERKNPQRIKDSLLGPREEVTLEDYAELTGGVFDDPEEIAKELEEEKRKIEEQHVKEKEAREEMLRNPSGDSVVPSVEGGHAKRKRNKKVAAMEAAGGTEEILGTIDD